MKRDVEFWCVLLIAIVVGCVTAEIDHGSIVQNIEQEAKGSSGFLSIDSWKNKCSKSYSSMCLKFDIVSLVNRLAEQDDIGILPSVSVVKQRSTTTAASSSDVVANLARDFPNDAEKRVDAYLLNKIGTYLNSHAISVKLFEPKSLYKTTLKHVGATEQRQSDDSKGDNAETARKKDKGGNGSMMAGLMMMKGTLGALGFGALAMLAGKALMTGLMALMLSAIVGLKSLTHGEKKTTYEIVSKAAPVHTSAHTQSSEEHHTGYAMGYGRSLNDEEVVHETLKAHGNVRDRRALPARVL
ncbi:uncharacterized protein LOC106642534 [Copidosoma floridanum]|uniref:uncharacterized protein LOC106642534 n=1 Tax=Copidosoma floridanum TaxID=29053 RepID=UPI0006C98A26|nr:uncharacterized protein LOC106642534 [Copidosoma floridanum]